MLVIVNSVFILDELVNIVDVFNLLNFFDIDKYYGIVVNIMMKVV